MSECQALRDENSSLSAEVASLKKKVELLDKVATETPESKRALCRILERYNLVANKERFKLDRPLQYHCS